MQHISFILAITLLNNSVLNSTSNDVTFDLQIGTYSKINLCRKITPIYERSARSPLECFKFCRILFQNICMSFKYQFKNRSCSIYHDLIRYDFYEIINGSCIGYQLKLKLKCPYGFTYLVEGNKCIMVLIGSWNWSEARSNCNALHPQSHPVIIDDFNDAWLMDSYLKFNVFQNCKNPLNINLTCYWTSGISKYIMNKMQPYVWNPFPLISRPLKNSSPWLVGQPNYSPSTPTTNCIQYFDYMGMDDYFCTLKLCVLCQIDMD